MSGGPPNVSADPESRPVLGNAGNKARIAASSRKPSLKKLSSKAEKTGAAGGGVGEMRINNPPEPSPSPSWTPRLPNAPSALLRRQETLLRSNLSLNASCSSDCSVESFRSRASTGRISGRPNLGGRRKQGFVRSDKTATRIENARPDHVPASSPEVLHGKRRCPWVTPNTEPCYATFHDEEWGVPVHDDMKLFELLVLSGALAELTWPVILSKRHLFREAFMDFDPDAVSKLNEKKIAAPGSIASSLLSEPKLRSVIENARQILKIIEEFGSFDRYCWNFVNHKPIISQFRYPRQVPVKTPKSEFISKDLVRRGFRFVGPTVIYSFMQVCGMTNDHLVSCYRFQECTSVLQPVPPDGSCSKEARERVNYVEENTSPTTTNINTVTEEENVKVDIVLPIEINDLNIS